LHFGYDVLFVGGDVFDVLLVVAFERELSHVGVEEANATKAIFAEGFDGDLLVCLQLFGNRDIVLVEQLLWVLWSCWLIVEVCWWTLSALLL